MYANKSQKTILENIVSIPISNILIYVDLCFGKIFLD